MNSNYDVLRDTIISKRQVICDYDGHSRKICPHVMGTKNDKTQVLSYQFDGTSSRGPPYRSTLAVNRWLGLDIFFMYLEHLDETFMLFVSFVMFVLTIGEQCHGNGRHGFHD